MGAKSSRNTSQNNRSDGHLLSYLRNTFVRGGGGAPLIVTYSVSPSVSSLNEGSSVTFTVTTNNVANGTTLYWTLNTVSGTINASDFSGGATSGSFTITNSSGSVVLTLANDTTTEGTESFQLQVRTDSTGGPIVATSSTVTINDTSQGYIIATAPGATTIDSGGFRTHIWTGPGSFVVSSAGEALIDYLVVAGGGGGGYNAGGGGGAGGFRTGSSFPITATTYPITVGGAGANATADPGTAGSGSPSIFSSITAAGGGGGGSKLTNGVAGGSGGGGGHNAGAPNSGGAGNTPPVSPPQGNLGGNGDTTSGGGGGGAGAAGPPGPGSQGGNGGIGSPITWIPASYGTPGPAPGRYFSGGGGGGDYDSPTRSSGGAGGGGAGGSSIAPAAGVSGTTNTGGGGGSNGNLGQGGAAGSGGSGIVAIRYPYV